MTLKRFGYVCGRAFQITGLALLPVAIWVIEYQKNEKNSIMVLVYAVVAFYVGYLLCGLQAEPSSSPEDSAQKP